MKNKSPNRPRYWHCLIGPIPNNLIHPMGDGPPRFAAQDAVWKMINGKMNFDTSSGWIEEEDARAYQKTGEELISAWNKRMIKEYSRK